MANSKVCCILCTCFGGNCSLSRITHGLYFVQPVLLEFPTLTIFSVRRKTEPFHEKTWFCYLRTTNFKVITSCKSAQSAHYLDIVIVIVPIGKISRVLLSV